MDIQGFRDLWKIGESTKRDPRRESKDRPPIGKFGIGKLATYVLAKGLTYVCKHDGKYRAVTMDFSILEKKPGLKKMNLKVREIAESDAQQIVAPVTKWDGDGVALKLFGKKAAKTWTAAAMTDLSPMARQLTPGRLQHVLRTALPLNPQFNLFFNGERLEPQKVDLPRVQTWTIGKDDAVAKELDFKTGTTPAGEPFVIVQLRRNLGHSRDLPDPRCRSASPRTGAAATASSLWCEGVSSTSTMSCSGWRPCLTARSPASAWS